MNILLIEPDAAAAIKLGDYLEERGNVVDYAQRSELAVQLAAAHNFHAIVLAARLARHDGFKLCRQLREQVRKSPVILFVGDEPSLDMTLAAFEAGADDYIARPVAMAEIRARLIALVRRGSVSTVDTLLRVGDLEVDVLRMETRRAGRRVGLTPTEFRLLRVLMEATPHVVTYADLDACLWGEEGAGRSDTNLRAQVYKLRLAIDKPFETMLIETRRNVGYRIADTGRKSKAVRG